MVITLLIPLKSAQIYVKAIKSPTEGATALI